MAYFIPADDPKTNLYLDGIFKEAYNRINGRFSPIIPVVESCVSDKYLQLLKWYDPDICVTYGDLSYKTLSALDFLISPIKIIKQTFPDQSDKYLSRPTNIGYETLSSLLNLYQYIDSFNKTHFEQEILILNTSPGFNDVHRFIGDNFGSHHLSYSRFPLRKNQLGINVKPLTLANPDENLDIYGYCGQIIHKYHEVLDQFVNNINCLTMHGLSFTYDGMHHFSDHPWNNGFNLFIGDTPFDRISAWNCRLLDSNQFRHDTNTLLISPQLLDDNEFVVSLCNFLRHRNHSSRGSSGGPPNVFIRTTKLDNDSIAKLQSALEINNYSFISSHKIENLDECIPMVGGHRRYYLSPFHEGDTNRTELSSDTGIVHLLPIQEAKYLSSNGLTRSGWMTDITIEYPQGDTRYSNDNLFWQFPRKNQVTRLFFNNGNSRVNHTGTFSLFSSQNESTLEVSIPNENSIFYSMLFENNRYPADDIRSNRPYSDERLDFKVSSNGCYLTGVIGLFGGLANTFRILSESFWKSRFLELSSPNVEKEVTIETRLKKKFNSLIKNGTLTIDDDSQWYLLAKEIRKIAETLRKPRNICKYSDLRESCKAYIKKVIDQHDNLKADEEEALKEGLKSFDRSLQSLCASGVFTQGFERKCRECGHNNWISINNFSLLLECAVCKHIYQVPPDFEWNFYLNEFLSTSLREQGILPLIWALGSHLYHPRANLVYMPPTDILKGKDRTPITDLDLLFISNGSVKYLSHNCFR